MRGLQQLVVRGSCPQWALVLVLKGLAVGAHVFALERLPPASPAVNGSWSPDYAVRLLNGVLLPSIPSASGGSRHAAQGKQRTHRERGASAPDG